MIEDVRLSLRDRLPVDLLPHAGGVVPTEEEVYGRCARILGGKA